MIAKIAAALERPLLAALAGRPEFGSVTANGVHLPLIRRWTTGSKWDGAVVADLGVTAPPCRNRRQRNMAPLRQMERSFSRVGRMVFTAGLGRIQT